MNTWQSYSWHQTRAGHSWKDAAVASSWSAACLFEDASEQPIGSAQSAPPADTASFHSGASFPLRQRNSIPARGVSSALSLASCCRSVIRPHQRSPGRDQLKAEEKRQAAANRYRTFRIPWVRERIAPALGSNFSHNSSLPTNL